VHHPNNRPFYKNKIHTLNLNIHLYNSKEIRKFTIFFSDTKIKIAICPQNTIQNTLRSHPQKSGIYQIKCLDCPLKYAGQTGRTFNAL
jgi:hypothetical protein